MFKKIEFPDAQSFIAISLVIAMIGLVFVLVFVKAPDSDVFKMLIGGLMTTGFASIIGYYFGSSKGSTAKDDTISALATNAEAVPVPAAAPAPPVPVPAAAPVAAQ